MSSSEQIPIRAKYLTAPAVERRLFEQNHLEAVYCQFQFPALLHLETEKPQEFSSVWRSRFPIYEAEQGANISPAGVSNLPINHVFRDRHRTWNIGLTSTSLSISTNKYESFEKLVDEIDFVIQSSLHLLDTNFFTRIGLRFINKIPIGNSIESMNGAVNSHLSGIHASGVLGPVASLKTQVQGNVKGGGNYLFQYGIASDPASVDQTKSTVVLDFDYSDTDIDSDKYIELLTRFHEEHYPFFWWSLGDESKEKLEREAK